MKAYKIFNNDWTCKDHKFEVGKTYSISEPPVICERGFHACTLALDCFRSYDPVQWNKFAEVELCGEIVKHAGDSKVASNKITIIKELSFDDFMEIIKAEQKVTKSNGVTWSNGVTKSNGVTWSNGVTKSNGVTRSLFVSDFISPSMLFNKPCDSSRVDFVTNEWKKLCDGWYPRFNNLHSLYLKSGSKWECTPIPNAQEISRQDAWSDMPKEALDYLRSLPEFDAKVFEAVTGIKSENKQQKGKV